MLLQTAIIVCASFTAATAFSLLSPVPISTRNGRAATRSTTSTSSTTLYADVGGVNPASDLTSALARLDQQWKIQQRGQPRSRWTKLVLPSDGTTASTEESAATISPPFQDFCYLLEPPNNSLPSCLIVFTGGAGLGAYPHIAYNEFLLRLSNRLNAAVLTAPYQVGLDHFALAKSTGEITRRAILHCRDDTSRLYPASLPVYSLSHSLGCKLSCIYIAATEQLFDAIGYISFNNFSFGKTISMAKEFAETIRKSTGMDNQVSGVSSEALNSLFNFAEMAVSAVGIEFSPSQSDMNRLISVKYDEEQQLKTRLFTFDEDVLENTEDVFEACNGQASVSGLPGTHLTPVYFKLGLEDLPDLPPDARDAAREAMGGFQSASFGNEDELNVLVTEVCDWIMGKGPSRKPSWLRERPQIAGAAPSVETA
jgi:Protein of unknown function (DUF1350)